MQDYPERALICSCWTAAIWRIARRCDQITRTDNISTKPGIHFWQKPGQNEMCRNFHQRPKTLRHDALHGCQFFFLLRPCAIKSLHINHTCPSRAANRFDFINGKSMVWEPMTIPVMGKAAVKMIRFHMQTGEQRRSQKKPATRFQKPRQFVKNSHRVGHVLNYLCAKNCIERLGRQRNVVISQTYLIGSAYFTSAP